jgi:hypothetical protein
MAQQNHPDATLEVSISEPFRDRNGKDLYSLHKTDAGRTLIVRMNSSNVLFDLYNKNNSSLFSEKLRRSSRTEVVGSLFNGTVYKLFTINNVNRDQRELRCYSLNINSSVINELIIDTFETSKKQNIFGTYKRHENYFKFSPDENLYATVTSDVSKRKNAFTVSVYNSDDDSKVYSKRFVDTESYSYAQMHFFVSNDGLFTLREKSTILFSERRELYSVLPVINSWSIK